MACQQNLLVMKISIALVSYNAQKFIREQIDSILINMSENDELIISDDGSSDDTLKIVNEYVRDDTRIKLYEISHSGCNANYENAISHCSGDIIVLSDDDNVWMPNKLEAIKKIFNTNSRVSFVMHDCRIVNENLELIEESFLKYNKAKPGLLRNFIKSRYGGSLISFRKELLKYILPFPKNMGFFYDDWIGMMAEKHGKVIFIPEKLSLWRRYSGASSTQFIETDGQVVRKKKKHIKGLLKRIRQRFSIRFKKLIYLITR